jgi:hypothetical protein
MVEYILCYGGPALHWGFLPATRLASRKVLNEKNIKKRTGPALCALCVEDWGFSFLPGVSLIRKILSPIKKYMMFIHFPKIVLNS